jgi:hypothetical protein
MKQSHWQQPRSGSIDANSTPACQDVGSMFFDAAAAGGEAAR